MKKQKFVRYTSEELENLPSQTDWTRFDEMSEQELERNALEDPDTPPWSQDGWVEEAEYYFGRIRPPKRAVSIRLDTDVLDFFKAQGRGYQSKINAVLRSFVQAQDAKAKSIRVQASKRRGAAKKTK